MPKRMIRGCEYFVEEHGTGKETVVFIHGLFMSGRAWHNQVLALRSRYRCVEYDLRGHGRSASPRGGYDMDNMAEDLLQLIVTGKYGPCHLVGSAMGALIAMHVAIKRPELVRSLTLIAATAEAESEEQKRQFLLLALGVRSLGTGVFAGRLMNTIFAEHFRHDTDRKIQVDHWRNEFKKCDRIGVSQALRAYARRASIMDRVGRIRAPTLVLAGERDTVCPPPACQRLHEAISGSRFLLNQLAGHCPAVETPDSVNEALTGFLAATRHRRREA